LAVSWPQAGMAVAFCDPDAMTKSIADCGKSMRPRLASRPSPDHEQLVVESRSYERFETVLYGGFAGWLFCWQRLELRCHGVLSAQPKLTSRFTHSSLGAGRDRCSALLILRKAGLGPGGSIVGFCRRHSYLGGRTMKGMLYA